MNCVNILFIFLVIVCLIRTDQTSIMDGKVRKNIHEQNQLK